jgi:hypothetical protein
MITTLHESITIAVLFFSGGYLLGVADEMINTGERTTAAILGFFLLWAIISAAVAITLRVAGVTP